jgi:dynein assembly factor with WDR repeat domains 1
LTGSIDRTCKLWDVASGQCIETFKGHNDEVLDATFNNTGNKLATASADGLARVYNVFTGACTALFEGHENEISKIQFNP